MNKIGIVSEYFYPHLGGVTEHVYFFAKELVRRGFEVVILTGYRGEAIDVPLPDGLRVIQVGRSFPIYSNHSIGKVSLGLNLGKRVKKILEEEKFDLLHIHSPLDPVLPLLFLKYSETLTVGTFHTYFKEVVYLRIFNKIARNYLEKLDGRIAVAPSVVEAWNRYMPVDFKVIPNGVDVEFFSRPSGKVGRFENGTHQILFLGRLDPRNGLDLLLEAFPIVLEKIPDARLIIVGDGPLRPHYEKKAGKRLNRHIFFEGSVNEARPAYFASAQVFCYAATIASFGIALLEAMAAGVPIVATDNKGFRALIQDGQNGLLFENGSRESLARALCRVLEEPSLARALAANARRSVEKFSWSRVADQVIDYYQQIQAKPGRIGLAS